jgi:ankyrin repeat protein
LKSSNALKQLGNLPKTLEGTYTRILQKVPEDNEREMRTILMTLAFSVRPMTIDEVAEATAVNLETRSFSEADRFETADTILELCSSLVSVTPVDQKSIVARERMGLAWGENAKIIKFAHFSVKEYVLSDMKSSPPGLRLNASLCQRYLTEMCLIYLLDFNQGESARNVDCNEFPFRMYSAVYWTKHLRHVDEVDRVNISELLIRLFDPDHPESLINLMNICDPLRYINPYTQDSPILGFTTQWRSRHDFETPLFYASHYGIIKAVDAILGKSYTPTTAELTRSLEAAAARGHDAIVRRLLAEGAHPNERGGRLFFRPIQAAAHSGSASTVKLLLEAGAHISPASYDDERLSALHVAATQGNVECIQLLLDAGHEINCISDAYQYRGTPLQVAAYRKKEEAVKCLLRIGADPNVYLYKSDYPLLAACENCSLEAVGMMLVAGADARGNGGTPPIFYAAQRGDIPIMKLLLQGGADINAHGGIYGTPLKGGIQSRDPQVLEFMLEHRVDINDKGSEKGYPVDIGIWGGNVAAAERLLELGAKFSDTALKDALENTSKEYLVKRLLDRGADPNAEHSEYGNMLQWAIVSYCQRQTIDDLLKAGAEVNEIEGKYGTALQAAVIKEKEQVVRLLLENGADPNVGPGGEYGYPLQAAIAKNKPELVQLLLGHGARIEAAGGKYGTSLQAAAFAGNERVMDILLKKGVPDVNTVGGEFGTALRAAIAMQHESIVKTLLDAGADIDLKVTATHDTKAMVNFSQTFHSTLELAIATCNIAVLDLLFHHGMVFAPEHITDALVHAVGAVTVEHTLRMIDLIVAKGVDLKRYGGKALVKASGRRSNSDVVRKLIYHNAPVDCVHVESYRVITPLTIAITHHEKENIQILLDAGADVNFSTNESGAPLTHAVENGSTELVLDLLDRGADLNARMGELGTALMMAIRKGDDDIFHMLLERGADVNIVHGFLGNALQTALTWDYYHLASELLDRGADPSLPGRHANALICASGRLDVFNRILDANLDLEAFDIERPEDVIRKGDRWYYNALQYASQGNEAAVILLLNAGANINAVGGTMGTALNMAVNQGQERIVKLLLTRGADINLIGVESGTALQVAIHKVKAQLAKLLLERGADVNIEGGKYGTALQAACDTSNVQVVSWLLERGAKVNTSCGLYGNPLQAAAHRGEVEHVETLLEHDADVNLRGGKYGCALQAAAVSERDEESHLKVIKILLAAGADVNLQEGEFGTPLQAAAYHHRAYVEILLKHGADPTIKGGTFGSAVEAAKAKGFNRVVKLLEQGIAEEKIGS